MTDAQAQRPAQAARQNMLRSLLPGDVVAGFCDPLDHPPAPMAEELACLSPNAVEKRRREFAAGRAAARDMMAALGLAAQPIPVGTDRAPVWPADLVGSISHTKTAAMAIGTTAGRSFRGLGIDVEEDTPLKRDLWDAICSPQEQDWLNTQDAPEQMGKVIFSAKEAAYKCQYGISNRFYGFDGMTLDLIPNGPASGTFVARFTADQPPFRAGNTLPGRYAIGHGLIITLAYLES